MQTTSAQNFVTNVATISGATPKCAGVKSGDQLVVCEELAHADRAEELDRRADQGKD